MDDERTAQRSALAGVISLLVTIVPSTLGVPLVGGVSQYLLKVVEFTGLLPIIALGALLLAVTAIVLGHLVLSRIPDAARHLPVIGLVCGYTAAGMLLLTMVLSAAQHRLWVPFAL